MSRVKHPADHSLMDELLRVGIPEIKLGLGEVIDRENSRPLPPRYARLLPETVLLVTLRPDAADALQTIAADLERELTDSCNRHGSLYDRSYRVRLQRSGDGEAPLYTVTVHAGRDLADASDRPPDAAVTAGSNLPQPPAIPLEDPDATRIATTTAAGWEPGRWVLVVEGEAGEEREAFTIGEPQFTVGRRTDDPRLGATIAISDAPHVSRRQLALVWKEREGAPGFALYNLGLNAIHLPDEDIPGSRTGKKALALDEIPAASTGWLPPGVPLRIGDHGPTLRVEEVPPGPDDEWIHPDATVFG